MNTYKIAHDTDDGWTILSIDERGELHDLNATGVPCRTLAQLALWIEELRAYYCISDADADDLQERIGR